MKHALRHPSLVSLALAWSATPVLAACASQPAAEPADEPSPAAIAAVDPAEQTLLLQDPTLSAEHIVFRYAEDLWIVVRTGGEARRLTSSPGNEASPQLSPDGRLVAFTGEYEGNEDVYVISVDGGLPRRLTYHPGDDGVIDWAPDGSGVIFRSMRAAGAFTPQAYIARLDGGTPVAYELPSVSELSIHPEATHFAYTSTRNAFGTWKRYRGGRLPSVWIFDRATQEVEVVPHVRASDTWPGWLGGDVYFASDRDGVMNLYRYAPGGKDVEQLTRYADFHIRSMDAGPGAVVFEQAGALHLYEPASGKTSDLVIRVRADGLAAQPRWQVVKGHVRDSAIAPNGKRAVYEARGEIITVPKEHGDARNLTSSPGVHDRSPVWSPDGERIAWFSDESGEYRLVVRDRRGREEAKSYQLDGAGFYYDPQWSPDGEHILYTDKGNRLAYLTLETGVITEVATVQGSLGTVDPTARWSADSLWLAFEDRNPRTLYDSIALYELATGTKTSVTDDFAAAADPAFSRDGKHLFFVASTNRGPHFAGLNMTTSAVREWSGNLYFAVLQKDGENPLFPKSDDAVDDEKDDEKDADEDEVEVASDASGDEEAGEQEDSEKKDEPDLPALDLEGLDQRILALPTSSGRYSSLACSKKALLYLESTSDRKRVLKSFDFEERESKEVMKGPRGFEVSADGKSLLTWGSGGSQIMSASGKDAKKLAIDSVRVRVEPRSEWPQILREVWRIQRDYFYDPNLHGADWPAMWERWSAFLPHVQHRSDLTLLIRELIGELSCGHEYVRGGEKPKAPEGISVGLLGADWVVEDGRYRLARILEGQNWNPGLRAPLTEPGVDAGVGDYLLAVNDRPLDASQNLYEAFLYTAGKQVDLLLSASADGADARTTTVVPVGSEFNLRFASWIESNRRRVEERSEGRLAYIYMPDTSWRGRTAFDRDWFSQLHKEGVVLDERYNGGGQVADYVIDMLGREVQSYWMNREAWVLRTPLGVLEGPRVMIANESAGSGGDWMPWAFQRAGLGKLVGTTTWGGLVGISGYPPLMDGGSVTAASFGVMDTEGRWAVENVGVAPDVEVIQWPKQLIAGEDPQLDRAIDIALEELEYYERRPDPVYVPPDAR